VAIVSDADGIGAKRPGLVSRLRHWLSLRIADPAFQARAVANPFLRPLANRQAAQLYDLVAGFVYSQILLACVEIDLFRRLREAPRTVPDLARDCGLPPESLQRLVQGAAALDLLRIEAQGRIALGPLGAALLGAPGVEDMVRHHPMLYRDLTDPVGLLASPRTETELSKFWSYVHGRNATHTPQAAAYSRLMASSQAMVAAETLAVAPLRGVRCLMDVGGGEGAFLTAALAAFPVLRGQVFDLPDVAARARTAFERQGLSDRACALGGSFRDPELPRGCDAISLIRVLYDHDTPVVQDLLSKVIEALPPGGRVIVSEPMSGGARPTRAGDAYFGFYTAAMTSGQPRSVETHCALLARAGFVEISAPRMRQPFITRVVTGVRPTDPNKTTALRHQ